MTLERGGRGRDNFWWREVKGVRDNCVKAFKYVCLHFK